MECNLDNIVSVFHNIQKETNWDISQNLKWGYFFFDKNKDKLITVFESIQDRGYFLEELHENEDGFWVLQISKIEIHTPESLNNRNHAMNKLASHNIVEYYDGWDVGQVE